MAVSRFIGLAICSLRSDCQISRAYTPLTFDGIVPRETALILPFLVAFFGALVLGVLGWRVLGRGFGQTS